MAQETPPPPPPDPGPAVEEVTTATTSGSIFRAFTDFFVVESPLPPSAAVEPTTSKPKGSVLSHEEPAAAGETHDFGTGPVAAHKHPAGGGWVCEESEVHETVHVALRSTVFRSEVKAGASLFAGTALKHSTVREGVQLRDALVEGADVRKPVGCTEYPERIHFRRDANGNKDSKCSFICGWALDTYWRMWLDHRDGPTLKFGCGNASTKAWLAPYESGGMTYDSYVDYLCGAYGGNRGQGHPAPGAVYERLIRTLIDLSEQLFRYDGPKQYQLT